MLTLSGPMSSNMHTHMHKIKVSVTHTHTVYIPEVLI